MLAAFPEAGMAFELAKLPLARELVLAGVTLRHC
jgi:hypothetical protein